MKNFADVFGIHIYLHQQLLDKHSLICLQLVNDELTNHIILFVDVSF